MTKLKAALGLNVVDFGVGMSAALVAAHLGEMGATVRRAECDGGNPFLAVYPAYRSWHRHAQNISLEDAWTLLELADVCIIGGESFPDLDWSFDPEDLASRFPRLIVLDIGGGTIKPQVDLLAQARSGLSFEQYSDRPIAWAFPAASYGATLQALIGIWVALNERLSSGIGQIVTTSLDHGVAMTTMPDRLGVERPDAVYRSKIPLDVRQLVFECADGHFIQFAMQRPGALAAVHKALGINVEVDATAAGHKQVNADPKNFFGDWELFQAHAIRFDRPTLLKALWEQGVAADLVLDPGECWSDAQAVHNGIVTLGVDGERVVGNPIRIDVANDCTPSNRAVVQAKPASADGPTPFSGMRVVGFGTFIAGPYAAKALADMGADVIKVDGPIPDPNTSVYAAWAMCNPGKRSIIVDIKTPEGKEVVQRLCATAQVVHHNFRPSVAERLGLGPSTLRESVPSLVTLQTSAYGGTGPKALNPGLDPILQAIAGHMTRAGGKGNSPLWYRTAVVDYATGAMGTIGILAGLFISRTSGCAVEAETNLFDTSLYLMSELVQQRDGSIAGAPMLDADQCGLHPAERLYHTNDGWIAITARSTAMADRLAAALNLDLPERSEWGTIEQAEIGRALAAISTVAALDLLASNEVWAERCKRIAPADYPTDADAIEAGLVTSFDDPHYGRVTGVGSMFSLSRSTIVGPTRAPRPGEHTREILTEIGYSDDAIDNLYRRAVVA